MLSDLRLTRNSVRLVSSSSKPPVRVHIGCGIYRLPGYINCDFHESAPGAEVRFDCQEKWPFEENSVDEVMSSHVLEHLPNPFGFFEHSWRAMRDGGKMIISLPYGGHVSAWSDITHVRAWWPETFTCFQANSHLETRNPQHIWHYPFGIDVIELRVEPTLLKFWKRWYLRRVVENMIPYILNGIAEQRVFMTAVKTSLTQDFYAKRQKANWCYIRFVDRFTGND